MDIAAHAFQYAATVKMQLRLRQTRARLSASRHTAHLPRQHAVVRTLAREQISSGAVNAGIWVRAQPLNKIAYAPPNRMIHIAYAPLALALPLPPRATASDSGRAAVRETTPRARAMSFISRGLYGGGDYDRHNNARVDDAYVDGMLRHPSARYLLLDGQLRVFLTDDGLPRWFTSFDALSLVERAASDAPPILFLGADGGGAPLCAIRLLSTVNFDADRFASLRDVASVLPRQAVTLAAHARSLFAFHDTHAYCGCCGARTRAEHGGARRRCVRAATPAGAALPAEAGETGDARPCRGMWYPRVDPAVIMLIVHPSGEQVLLGRQSRYPAGMYSCLAGHMEHGEGVEDAVRRETLEETAVSITNVRFFGSQPWPFPYTLMLACVVQATSVELVIDRNELEDAHWVSREDLARMLANREHAMRTLSRQRTRAHSKREERARAGEDD
eukprot:IDg19809t1